MTRASQSTTSKRHSPYPTASVDSASDYSPESTPAAAPVKRRSRNGMTPEERRDARAHRNRIAAQCSRDRKKAQFSNLQSRVDELEAENRALRTGVVHSASQTTSPSAVQENIALRLRVQQLEQAWQNLAKVLGSLPLPPLTHATTTSSNPLSSLSLRMPSFDLPLSPAPTSVSVPESSTDTPFSDPTCESAAGGLVKEGISLQVSTGADSWLDNALYASSANPIVDTFKTIDDHLLLNLTPDHSLPGTESLGLVSSTTLEQGSLEMERLLSLLPDTAVSQPVVEPSVGDDWSWLTNEGVF